MTITIKEACELAKSGVQLTWHEIRHDVVSDLASPAPDPFSEFGRDNGLFRMLSFRMHWQGLEFTYGRIHPAGFNHITVHKSDDKTVLVFVVQKDGKYLVVEDEWNLFPSDALITQLRLLEQ
jgi:hypothetical protein